MKKTSLHLAAVRELHQAGKLEDAKKGYETILKNEPQNSEALHALGIIEAQFGNFDAAINNFQLALAVNTDDSVLYLNLGNALKSSGRLHEAITMLEKAVSLNPQYAAAHNNLGTVYFAQHNLEQSERHYRKALQIKPDYIDASYNLALALGKQHKIKEAMSLYEKIISASPTHAAAHFQLGCLLLGAGTLTKAESHFLLLEENYPFHFETQTNLGTCYLKQGALGQARIHYKKALELSPEDTQVLFNLGVITMQLGETDNAIQYFQRAIRSDPDNFPAHNNLGVAFLSKQHPNFALEHFKQAQRLQPDNAAIRYTVQMLSQDQRLLGSPPEYIKNLFDTYADHYEVHLQQALDYKVPEEIFNAVSKVIGTNRDLDILDLGCGTGLCGIPFQSRAKTLEGVDLSPNMLAVAADKKIYTRLSADDLVHYLTQHNNTYDLIIAGDVFVYLGDLNTLFTAASHALHKNGIMAFNTEITDKTDYSMNQSGRFAHQKEYLDKLAKTHGLHIISYQTIITRQQNNAPVSGHLYVLQKLS